MHSAASDQCLHCLLASVAQLNVHQACDQAVTGWTPELFSTVILSLPLILEGQLSISGERICTILVNCLED